MDALIAATDLTVNFRGGITALDGLDLHVPASGITCLLGANGAGKTTLLETAAGLVQPSTGTLEVLGVPPGSLVNRLRLGVMLQDGGIPGSARPREFLEYVARLYPYPKDVAELLALVEIDPATRTPIRRLSGGQQRRLAWAASMVGDPSALLLDEPTAGVDPVGREQLHAVLRSLRDQGIAMVISTHLVEDVEALADFVVVLRHGRQVLSDTPEQLRPRNALLVRALRAMDERALLSALPAGSTCERSTPDTYLINVPSGIDPAVMSTVSSWCGQHSVPPDLSVGDLRSVLWSALRGDNP